MAHSVVRRLCSFFNFFRFHICNAIAFACPLSYLSLISIFFPCSRSHLSPHFPPPFISCKSPPLLSNKPKHVYVASLRPCGEAAGPLAAKVPGLARHCACSSSRIVLGSQCVAVRWHCSSRVCHLERKHHLSHGSHILVERKVYFLESLHADETQSSKSL